MNAEARHLPATYAAIVFSGKDFDPHIVTAVLGTTPTLSHAFGSEYLAKDVIRTRKYSLWVFSTRNNMKSDNLSRHLHVIEELLIGPKPAWPNVRIEKIRDFIEAHEIEMRVDVFWYGAENAALPDISRSFDQVVTMAGGRVATDFHRDGDAIEAPQVAFSV